MYFHIFNHVRQHIFHETQLGIPSLNCNEHGKVFSLLASFCTMSFTFTVEGLRRNTEEAVDLKIKLFFRIWKLQNPKARGIQKEDFTLFG